MLSESTLTLQEPLEVWGSGFLPGEPVTLVLVIDDIVSWTVGSRDAEQPVANAAGAFQISFDSIIGGGGGEGGVITERAPGIRTIVAEGEDGSRASVPVVITESTPPRTSPSTSLTASVAEVDGDFTIWGAGFKPNEFVSVIILAAIDGDDIPISGGEANASGAITLQGTLGGREESVAAGVYTLRAVGDLGSEATTPLRVLTEK